MASRNGSAVWNGDLNEGNGELTVGAGVFTGPFTFKSRFEDGEGTNPEEMIAAAHAGCYSMALSNVLGQAGITPERISTKAGVELRLVDGKPTITKIQLDVEATVPGLDDAAFQEHAEAARAGCVVTRALAGVDEIALDAKLAG